MVTIKLKMSTEIKKTPIEYLPIKFGTHKPT